MDMLERVVEAELSVLLGDRWFAIRNIALEASIAKCVADRVLGTIPAESKRNFGVRHSTRGFRGGDKSN